MKRRISLLIIALLPFTACEDYLTKYPSDQVTRDLAIQTLDDAKVALNGVYSGFKSAAYYGRYFVVHADVQTDLLQSVIGYSNQLGELYKWSYLSDNGDITSAWDVMYKVIVRSSNIIDALPSLEDGSEKELKAIEGQARMARALAHFDLVKAFAKAYTQSNPDSDPGVPIVTTFKINAPERNTIADVYKFIRDEALLAADLLSDNGKADIASVFFTQASAFALLARASLYMGEWEDAVVHSTAVIDNTSFELNTDSADLADMYLNDHGKEVIFRIGLTRGDFDGRYIGYNYYNNSQGAPSVDYIPAEWIINLYNEDDIRPGVIFKNDSTKYGWAWPMVWKYPGNPLFYSGSLTTNANMYKVFRLSEMYLIRAEANAEMGLDIIAVEDYNELRRNRIIDYSDENLSGQALKDAIWNERIRELAFEGHYLWDLKRTGRGFTRVPIQHPDEGLITNPGPNQNELSVSADNNKWLWPIPDNELRANPNITPNPGY
jgi:starch-binding outer membrane protein, SusD/RagB family